MPSMMRTPLRFTPAIVALAFAPLAASAQQPAPQSANSFAAGFGVTSIDGQTYILFNASPEFNLGKIGVGLDANFRWDTKQSELRSEDWNSASDVLAAIRYVRYGVKGNGFSFRWGQLDQSTLGYGQVMYLYNNSAIEDNRKAGGEIGFDMGRFGVEMVYSNFARPEVAGARGYFRPLHGMTLPILNRLEIGATAATDLADSAGFDGTTDKGAPMVMGADIGLPLLRNSMLGWTVYAEMAKISGAGSGSAIGTQFNFTGLGLVRLNARMEHRMAKDGYVPSYFNSYYELDRFNSAGISSNPNFMSRYQMVKATTASGNGMYGELSGDVVNVVRMRGSYQRLYGADSSGWLHIDAGTGDKLPMVTARASYDRWSIAGEGDLIKLDDRSMAELEVGYRPNRFMTVSLVSQYTFTPSTEPGEVGRYVQQKRIEPRVTFGFQF